MKTYIKALAAITGITAVVLPMVTFAAVGVGVNTDLYVGAGSSSMSGSVNTSSSVHTSGNGSSNMNSDSRDSGGSVQVGVSVTSPLNVISDTDVTSYSQSLKQSDAMVAHISSDDTTVSVTYKERGKFLGFIPVTLKVIATSDAAGNVTVSHPWYDFLTRTNDADIQASAQAGTRLAATSATVSADAGGTISLTARLKASLIQALHTALKTHVDAQASGSAGSSY